jgi:predicted molibdopterin-dependent oxidoreductase YjgC
MTNELQFDGQSVPMRDNDTIGSALMRAGILVLRRSRSGEPRGLYCAIGVCNDCLVNVDGVPNVRACVTPATAGLNVVSGGLAR